MAAELGGEATAPAWSNRAFGKLLLQRLGFSRDGGSLVSRLSSYRPAKQSCGVAVFPHPREAGESPPVVRSLSPVSGENGTSANIFSDTLMVEKVRMDAW
nr:hypothetical protein Itr_chr14CG08810 [Ipomoea trifida]